MNYKTYLEACKKFARDSEPWLRKDDCSFYVTRGDDSDWVESCDNACGGIDVSWAFHMTDEKIEQEAPERYAQEIILAFIDLPAEDDGLEIADKYARFFEYWPLKKTEKS